MKKTKAIIWGILLIAAGLLWACSTLGILEVDLFFEGWWTLFIIVPSFISLITSRDKVSAAVCLTIGVLLLLCAQDILSFDLILKLIVPAIVVFIGIKLIWNAFFDSKAEKSMHRVEMNYEDAENVFSCFNGVKANCDGKVFRGAEINAVFGGAEYDLRGAIIEPDSAIKATAVFGGIDIRVPENVKVRVKSTSIFGGVDNKAKRADDGAADVVTLYISATCLFGGIEIK